MEISLRIKFFCHSRYEEMGEKKSSPESVKMPFLRLAINYLIIEVVGKLLNCNMSKIEPSASNLPKVSLFL
jgi:hypothetical protein